MSWDVSERLVTSRRSCGPLYSYDSHPIIYASARHSRRNTRKTGRTRMLGPSEINSDADAGCDRRAYGVWGAGRGPRRASLGINFFPAKSGRGAGACLECQVKVIRATVGRGLSPGPRRSRDYGMERAVLLWGHGTMTVGPCVGVGRPGRLCRSPLGRCPQRPPGGEALGRKSACPQQLSPRQPVGRAIRHGRPSACLHAGRLPCPLVRHATSCTPMISAVGQVGWSWWWRSGVGCVGVFGQNKKGGLGKRGRPFGLRWLPKSYAFRRRLRRARLPAARSVIVIGSGIGWRSKATANISMVASTSVRPPV